MSELNNDILAVKQLVARSRPGVVRSHPDVQRLEKDVDAITTRWENLSIQMAERCVSVCIPNFHRMSCQDTGTTDIFLLDVYIIRHSQTFTSHLTLV